MTRLTKRTRGGPKAVLSSGAALLLTMTGCSWFGGDDEAPRDETLTTRPTIDQTSYTSERPLPTALQPKDRPLTRGQLPLAAIIQDTARHRVIVVATGEEIANFDAISGQVVRVEPRGVLLESKVIMGATLSPGAYAVEVVGEGTTGTVVATQTRTTPVAPKPQPASRPATPQAPPPAPAATPPPR